MNIIYRDIAAGLIVSKDGKLLMGKKDPARGGVYKDCWHIPGGGIDTGESPLQALAREMKEEVNLDIADCEVALADDKGTGESEKTLADTGERVVCKMKFYVYRIDVPRLAAEIPVTPGDDMFELTWIDMAALGDYNVTPPSASLFRRLGYIK